MRTSNKNEASTLKLSNIKSSHTHCYCGSPYSAAPGCNCFASSVGCDGSEVRRTESPSQEDNSPKVSTSVAAQDLCADRTPENVHANDSSRQVSLSVCGEREVEDSFIPSLFLTVCMHLCMVNPSMYMYASMHFMYVSTWVCVRVMCWSAWSFQVDPFAATADWFMRRHGRVASSDSMEVDCVRMSIHVSKCTHMQTGLYNIYTHIH